jgi:hypothetical protein
MHLTDLVVFPYLSPFPFYFYFIFHIVVPLNHITWAGVVPPPPTLTNKQCLTRFRGLKTANAGNVHPPAISPTLQSQYGLF